ncbi:MAG: hypothetical protein HOL01_17015 [Planctomycetaceae bacterium]|nr:hypothetical protein [Planctomycetaceae bacterium]MBT6483218.1 hypothetical protein [Planctomycetaceae bacterium]MBT6496248.1 hypothetical protein [Planctomycetaceae bacterium]
MIGLRENSAKLREVRAVNKEVVDGVECHVFRTVIRNGDRDLLVEAFADIKTKQLRSIVCWANGNSKRTGPPIAELKLIARNVPVDELKFVVAKTLTEDGRIGKIVDRQGIVSLKPLGAQRWTPVVRNLVVKPGDWIRTGRRGANAVQVVMEAGYRVTVGPATLIEVTAVDSIKIHNGEAQIEGSKKPHAKLTLVGPNKQAVGFGRNTVLLHRVIADGALQRIKQKPIWLQGFEGTSANESLGSLIANVKDGGNSVNLSIGYHKVNVEIRDQIARTTIEESFVNHTDSRMEGVFHFPLPQDASISGFGMWINNELIEADVVEKQRAREIYEAILREKKDPALLEWTGGNIFKARVFPIEPHSEKRVRITYTQVLPMRANRYRYSYGLRSEMLQTTPLRELSLNVTVNSALPLKKVHSPTPDVRTQMTAHSARLEFEEQEYTPTRDFEVVCEVDARQSDVVVIPHRRGDDGYFMVQLTPPSAQGNWQRELLPDGDPMELLLVCDTSGSMDSHNRRLQSDFVSSVLASLGDDDRLNVAVADVDCNWLFTKPVAATKENVKLIQQRLLARPSLGWTDLDRTFASIQKKAGKNSHVIYIGDGVVSAGDADPQAFVARLGKLYDGKTRGTFHAVSVGSSFESVVLRAIARLGGGSLRSIDGEQTPQRVSLELLNEIAQPGLRDIEIEFRGVQVAAVYPDRLPNLAAGTQQILIGRYLPTGNDQAGEIIVSGKRGNDTVKYAAKLNLTDAERGNSFVPRLWARSHLDHLLDQGANAVIKDEIVGLSEEFHIITPYTSLLVLESDEQREQYGVKRRYQMRDGERFFADGRSNANFELRQQQMKSAGDWRIGLRNQILRHLTTLGRDPRLFQRQPQFNNLVNRLAGQVQTSNELSLVKQQLQDIRYGPMSGTAGSAGWGGRDYGRRGGSTDNFFYSGGRGFFDVDAVEGFGTMLGEDIRGPISTGEPSNRFDFEGEDGNGVYNFNRRFDDDGAMPADEIELSLGSVSLNAREVQRTMGFMGRPGLSSRNGSIDGLLPGLISAGQQILFGESRGRRYNMPMFGGGGYGFYNRAQSDPAASIRWISELFPRVPARPTKPAKAKPSKWPVEAVKISRSLVRAPKLAKLKGGIEIIRDTRTFDPAWKREAGRSSVFELYSTKRWLRRPTNVASPIIVSWADPQERGVLNASFRLGQTRKSYPEDFSTRNVGAGSYVHSLLHVGFQNYDVQVKKKADGTVTLRCTKPDAPDAAIRIFEVDTKRSAITEERSERAGKIVSRSTYGDFVEVGGIHWPTEIEVFNDKGQLVSRTTQTVKLHDDEKFMVRFGDELDVLKETQIIRHPLPKVSDSESAAAKGMADFEDRMVLMLRAALVQKWDTVLDELAQIQKLTPGKLGVAWMKASVLASARKNEDARQAWIKLGDELLAAKSDDLYLPSFVIGKVRSVADANESMATIDSLKPIFQRQPEYRRGLDRWNEHRLALLQQLGRTGAALRLQKALAESTPWDAGRQTRYVQFAHRNGEYDIAYEWLGDRLNGDEPWTPSQDRQFRRTYYNLLQQQGRADDAVKLMEEWIATESADHDAFGRYLVSLVQADRSEDADAIALKWLKAGQVEGELKGRPLLQLTAAISYATGTRVGMNLYEMDHKWFGPLHETARFFMDREHNWNIATNLIWNHRFSRSDEADQLRELFAKQLVTRVAEFDSRRANAVVDTVGGHSLISDAQWLTIIDVLLKKRSAATKDNQRNQFASTVLSIYRRRFAETKLLPFMRQRIAEAVTRKNSARAASLSVELFNVLIAKTWSAEVEDELFGLIGTLSPDDSAMSRRTTAVATLHRVVDTMIQKRAQADKSNLQDTGHPEKLTRTELAARYASFAKAAREALAKRLDGETKKHDDELADWCRMERIHLDVQLDRNLKAVETECWTVLDNQPPKEAAADDSNGDPAELHERRTKRALYSLLRDRAVTTLMNLAARRSASKESVAKLLARFDEWGKPAADNSHEWKLRRYQLLIALDRPDELEKSLRQWIANDEETSHWRRTLARLEAERGRFAEAIQLVLANERDSVLTAGDHALMSRWRMVLDDRKAYEQSRIAVLKAVPEYQLNNWINQRMRPWYGYNNRPVPTELDENVLFAFRALFEKSPNPRAYLSTLRQSYTACRDFRLLRMVPDGVLGRTPQQVYPFLVELHSGLLREVRNEATADEIVSRVKELRANRELTVIDKRALDLLECLVERRSAEVINQPGPHADAAVAALKRAFKHKLADGEIRQMASFLDSLGRLKQQPLIDEQLRQLRDLHSRTQPGTDDHVHVSWHLANTLFVQYGKREEGMTVMQVAIRAFEQSHPDGWPSQAEAPIDGYVSFFNAMGRVAAGEKFVKSHIANPLNEGQRYWFTMRLNRVYRYALSTHATVSLGSNDELLQKTIELLLQQVRDEHNDSHRYAVLSLIPEIFDTAHRELVFIPTASVQYRKYAFEQMPAAIKLLKNNYENVIRKTANSVKNHLGVKTGLEFLITTVENYPDRFQYTYQNAWRNHGATLGEWRKQVEEDQTLGSLSPRLLAIVIEELKRDMRIRSSYSRYIYGRHGYQKFWTAKRSHFKRAAEEVLKEQDGSTRAAMHVARYLHRDLGYKKRAIEIVAIQHAAGKLVASQQVELVKWLHEEGKYGETISILEPLVKKFPDTVSYRVLLITAYARSDRPMQTQELIVATDAHFRTDGRWIEQSIWALADCLSDIGRLGRAINYYNELIPLHQRTHKNRGIRSYPLSRYYRQLAEAHSALGHTLEAMDAASSDVVLWNKTDSQRTAAMNNVQSVLNNAKDLGAYIQHLDKQASANGTDSPMLRRMCGVALSGDGEHEAAVEQFELALQLDPLNKEARVELIKLLTRLKRPDEAIAQLMQQIDIERHNLALYTDLVDRTKDDDALSERAFTSIVESAPTEYTHHQKAAELRQGQNRWTDAIVHWQQVAKLQAFEPTGLLGLAEAQIREKKWDDARQTVQTLKKTEWPSRFRNIESQVRNLEGRIKAPR